MSGTSCSARLESAADQALKLSEQVVVDLPVAGFFSNGNPFRRKKVRVAGNFSLSLDQMTTKEMAKFSKNKCLSYFFSAPPAIINTWNYQPFENTLKNRAFQNHVEVFFWQNRASKVSKFFCPKLLFLRRLSFCCLTFDSNFSQSGDFLSNNCRWQRRHCCRCCCRCCCCECCWCCSRSLSRLSWTSRLAWTWCWDTPRSNKILRQQENKFLVCFLNILRLKKC